MAVVSAPGKVLVTGAYLVLERPNAGLVLSTSARFYAIVNLIHESLPDESRFWSWVDVRVLSPQLGKDTSYKLSLRTCRLQGARSNFVEDAVQYAVATALALADSREAVYKRLLHGLEITILGSNDFYSFRKRIEDKGLPLTAGSLAALPAFSPIMLNDARDSAPEVAKTGLGSSASMTTAIVAGILNHLDILQLPSRTSPGEDRALDMVHAASQAAHCHAQRKIGSGFDVSAAVYGSQRYVRFSPAVVDPAFDPVDDGGRVLSLEKAMKPLLDSSSWDCEHSDFALPQMLYLMLGEPGYGGSHTPSMVGSVNLWRKNFSDASCSWEELRKANEDVEEDLLQIKQLQHQQKDNYAAGMESCSKSSADQWSQLSSHSELVKLLLKTRQDFQSIRSLLRRIGSEAGVPIEPASQTELLDATMNLPGVLLAGVPGAGGFDAIFAITIGENARSIVEQCWSRRGVLTLGVHEDSFGVCVENGDPRDVVAGTLGNQIASMRLS